MARRALSDADLAAFLSNGYVIVRDFFPPEVLAPVETELAVLAEAAIDSLVERGLLTADAHAALPTKFEERIAAAFEGNHAEAPILFRSELHTRGMAALFLDAPLIEACAALMSAAAEAASADGPTGTVAVADGAIRIFPNYTARPKFAKSHEVSWHQDAGLTPDGSPNESPIDARLRDFGAASMINVWVPMVEKVSRSNGAMEFISGSHALGIQRHERVGTYASRVGGKDPSELDDVDASTPGIYNTAIELDAVAAALASLGPAIDVACGRGDVVLFSNLLFHRGGVNTSGKVRWSLDFRYQRASRATHRPQLGHIVAAGDGRHGPAIMTAEEWAAERLR